MTTGASPPSEPASGAGRSFGARAARGTLWTALRYAAEYSIRLASNLILTRLLFPEAFGVMALVNTLMAGLQMFSDIGLGTSVVQSARGDEPTFLRTAWTLQVLRGLLLWAVATALSPWMAAFYGQDDLRRYIPVTALTALIGGFNSVALIRMQRHLQLGRLAALELTTQTLGIAITIGWALAHRSVWALVGGGVAASLVKLIGSHWVGRHDVRGFAWEQRAARHLLGFGKWIFVSTLLAFFAGQADRLLFGKLFSVAMLGVYGIALVLSGLPTQLFWSVGNYVLFPTFSRQAESPFTLETSYRRLQRPVLLLGALPVVGLLACGPELIQLLYDPRYADAAWMVQLLAFGVWLQIPQTLSGNALLATGKPRWMAIGNGTKLLAMIVLIPAGYAWLGEQGAIAGLAAAEAFRWATFAFAVRRGGLPAWGQELLCSALVAATGLAGRLAVEWAGGRGAGAFVRLCAGSAAVLVVFLPPSAWLLRSELPGLWGRLRRAAA